MVGLATAGLAIFLVGDGLALIAPGSWVETAASVVQALAFLASLVGFIGAAIAVPVWMHRCYRNLPALGAAALGWSPAWAVGAWFIPIANLVLPYMVARELWAKASGSPVQSSSLLGLWWAACIAAVVINLIGNFHGNLQAGNVETRIGLGTGGSALSNTLAAVASMVAGVLLTIIQRITRRQRDRYSELLR